MSGGGGSSGRSRAFWLVRSRAHSGVLAATAVTVLVVTFLAAAMVGLAVRSPTVAVRQSIAAGPASSVSAALQATLASDAARQDHAVRSIVAKRFARTVVNVDRTAFVPSVAIGSVDAPAERSVLALAADQELRSRVVLTAGAWPGAGGSGSAEAPFPVAVDRELADLLHLAPGSGFTVVGAEATVSLTVSGVWRAAHPSATAWLGVTPGAGGTDGRLVIAPAAVDALSTTPAAQWVVAPDARRTTASQLARLHSGFSGIADALTEDSTASPSSFSHTGDAMSTVAAMQQSAGALSAVVPVPLAVLAVCSAIAFILLAQLLARSRLPETRLLRARGATVGDLLQAGAVESSAIALVGALIGLAAAQGVLLAMVGGPVSVVEVVAPAVTVVLAAVAASLLITGLSARSATGAPGAADAGRDRAAVSAGLAVIAFAAAGVTVWRFLAFGSPVAAGGRVDPVGVIAPAAVLCAIAMLGLLLFGPAAGGVEGLAARGRGVTAILPARQVGRGLALFAAPVALVVLTVGAATFSAGYVGTWSGFLRDSSHLVNGGDVRVDLGVAGSVRGPEDAVGAHTFARIPGAANVAPVLETEVGLGQGTIALIGVDARKLAGLTQVGAYMFDARSVSAHLRSGGTLRGARLAPGAKRLVARTSIVAPGSGIVPTLAVTFWVADDPGELVPLVARPTGDGSVVVSADLPPGGPWTLVAVDSHVDTGETAAAADVSVRSISTSAGSGSALTPVDLPPGQEWGPARQAFPSNFTLDALEGTTIGYRSPLIPAGSDNAVRFMARGDSTVPVVFTGATADDTALDAGQSIQLEGAWVDLEATVAGVVPAIPGTADEKAALVDLRSLDNQVLRTSPNAPRLGTVWIATRSTEAAATAARQAAGPDALVSTASGTFVSRFMSSAVVSLWLGTAGCAALALVALGAAVAALLRRRRGEVIVLRAIGMGARQQARSRRVEVLGVVIAAAVFGLIGGVTVFLLAGNALARLSVVTAPSTLSVQGRVDAVGLFAALGTVGVAVALVLWFYGSAVRRQVADTAYREETR